MKNIADYVFLFTCSTLVLLKENLLINEDWRRV